MSVSFDSAVPFALPITAIFLQTGIVVRFACTVALDAELHVAHGVDSGFLPAGRLPGVPGQFELQMAWTAVAPTLGSIPSHKKAAGRSRL
jgi:hypothetical protein